MAGAVQVRMKDAFFDKKAVIDAIGRARATVLSKFGAKVRKRAQASLVYTKDGKPAPPGGPPFARRSRQITRKSRKTGQAVLSKKTGQALKRNVSFLREFTYFAFDGRTASVVIGPERLNSTVDPRALAALEFGGPSTAIDKGRRVPISVRPHPFMGPALQAEAPGFPGVWKDSVR